MKSNYIERLLNYLDESPNNFFAVENLKKELESNGFRHFRQSEKWNVAPGDKFFVTKNDSSLFAFVVGEGDIAENGFKIISSHTDSPGFRIKPNPEIVTEGGFMKLNTEVYGGPIMYTWFDRPLSVAGRVIVRTDNPLRPESRLVKIDRPILLIPHIAIHFNRSVNEGNPLSKQKDMLPVAAIVNEQCQRENFLINIIAAELNIPASDILDFDLNLFECTKASVVGVNGEFISSGRLDDLGMVQASLEALIGSEKCKATKVLAAFDNEETGSGTKQGAASPVLKNIMERIVFALGGDMESFYRAIDNSFMISADMAHALHPNYQEKHDPTNHPVIGGGPVIKINANQKYLSDAETSAVFVSLCELAGVPCQYFVNHSDMAGGSTLGNILTSQMEIRGVDMGNPMWGMHSIRETCGTADHCYAIEVFTKFFSL